MMKFFALSIIGVCGGVTNVGAAPSCPFEKGRITEFLDGATLIEIVEDFPLEKSEFEKSDSFFVRRAEYVSAHLKDTTIFETMADRSQITYDADEEIFYFDSWLFSNGTYGPSSELETEILELQDPYDYQQAYGIRHRVWDEELKTGASEMEVKNITIFDAHTVDPKGRETNFKGSNYTVVQRYYGYEPVEVRPHKNVFGDVENTPIHSVAIPLDQAEEFKSSLRTFVAASVENPYVKVGEQYYEANYSLPYNRWITNYVIKVDVTCAAIADREGQVVKVFTPLDGYIEYVN